MGGEWHNSQLNYDNIFHAMFRVHYISMLDGWVALMFESMDVVGVDMQPKKESSPPTDLPPLELQSKVDHCYLHQACAHTICTKSDLTTCAQLVPLPRTIHF